MSLPTPLYPAHIVVSTLKRQVRVARTFEEQNALRDAIDMINIHGANRAMHMLYTLVCEPKLSPFSKRGYETARDFLQIAGF